MMIFDAHAHLGTWPTLAEAKENLLEGMRRKNVSFSLISHADCSSFPGEVAPKIKPLSAVEGLRQCLDFARENPGKIYIAVWVKPTQEEPSEELVDLIVDNRDVVKSFKLHPFCERIKACDPLMEPYYDLASMLDLPILVHTAVDEDSRIEHLVEAALTHPHLRFVAAHLELGSDHRHAIEALKVAPNVFCDTAWVDMESAFLAMDELGEERVFFGSDAPIDGAGTLENPMYEAYFANKASSQKARMTRLLGKNGQNFYKIP